MKLKNRWKRGLQKVMAMVTLVLVIAQSLPPAVFAQDATPDPGSSISQPSDIPTQPSETQSPSVDTPNSFSNPTVPSDSSPAISPDQSATNQDSTPVQSEEPGTNPTGASPSPAPSLPEAPDVAGAPPSNNVFDSQKPNNTEVNGNTGALTYRFPLAVPPGRNNLQPDLAIAYTSDIQELTSVFGKGWSISIPYIERENKYGVDTLYTSATSSQYFFSSIDGELATTTVTSTYAARVENGSFNKYTATGNQWVVKDKSGTQYTFGSTTSTRMDDPNNSANAYMWMLKEVRDTNDNYIRYTYYKDAGQIYPASILYTGNGSTDGIFELDFLRESRTDSATSWKTGFPVATKSRINEIDVKINGTLTHKYVLTYTTGDNGSVSLLTGVTESGADESGATSTLPATTFTYRSNNVGWNSDPNWNLPVTLTINGSDQGVKFADVTGDGLPDIEKDSYVQGVSQSMFAFINSGHNWTSDDSWFVPQWITLNGYDVGSRFVDLNGDRLMDLFIWDSTEHDNYINNGHGWTLDHAWDVPGGVDFTTNGLFNGHILADLNGDGLPDILYSANLAGILTQHAYINNGHGWTQDDSWNVPVTLYSDAAQYEKYKFADVNGDGLADFLYGDLNGSTYTYDAYINNGHGWTEDHTWDPPVAFTQSNFSDHNAGYLIIDVNGDGLPDVMRVCPNCAPIFDSYINNGKGWTSNDAWHLPLEVGSIVGSEFVTHGSQFPDINGDGLPDGVYSNFNGTSTSYEAYTNNGKAVVDLLSQINHSAGGSTHIDYQQAAAYFDGSNNLTNTSVPFAMNTVHRISTNDGTTTSTLDTYTYKGGKFQYYGRTDKKFGGFAEIDKTDSASSVTKTFYHTGTGTDTAHGEYTDNYFKIGKPYRIEKYDNNQHLYEKTINKWESVTSSTSTISGFTKLGQTVRSSYDGYSSHKDKSESYTYDNVNGNVTQKVEYGQVTGSDDGTFTDTGSDKFTTDFDYATSTSSAFMSIMSRTKVTDQTSTTVKDTKNYFDNLSYGIVAKGNQTKEENWTTTSTYINSQKTYNSYGLVATSTDPRGKATSYVYDGFNLYPATTTQPLSLVSQAIYNYANGKTATSIDPNGNKFANVYDGIGRLTLIKQPDPSATTTLLTKTAYAYNDATGTVSVLQTDYLDSTTTVKTYTYYDGLKRVKQTRRSTEGGYYETKDVSYNNVGLVGQESLPYFSSGASSTTATTAPALFTTYVYDALQRVKTGANAVGTTTKAYVNWKIIITDPNGNKKDLKYDAYGNLIEVDEHHNVGGGGMGPMMSLLNPEYANALMQPLMALADESTSAMPTVIPSTSFDPTISPEPSSSPSPTPSPSPSPTPSEEPSVPPIPSPSAEPSPSVSPVISLPEASPEPSPDSTASSSIVASPSPTPSPDTLISDLPIPSPTASPEPIDTMIPKSNLQPDTSKSAGIALGWNSNTETLHGANKQYEFHTKQINFEDADGTFKPINVTPVPTASGWEVTQNTFIAKFPARSGGVAEMLNNNRFDTRTLTDINESVQTMTITALEAADVAGVLEYGDVGYGQEWYVRYPQAYPAQDADLIYLVWHGKVPRLQKLVRFNSALASDTDFRFQFSYPDKDPDFTPSTGVKWDKASELISNRSVSVGKAGDAHGFGMKDFAIWDTGIGSRRKIAAVSVDLTKNAQGYVLAKRIPASFFHGVVYPVFTDTTFTVYPDPNPETTSVDGYFNCDTISGCGSAGNWSSVVNAASSNGVDDSGNSIETNARDIAGRKIIRRAALLFDTSVLGSGVTVTSASLYVMPFDFGTPSESAAKYNIYSSNPASSTALVVGDYSSFGTTAFATSVAPNAMTAGTYVSYLLNASGVAAISKTGITKMGIRDATYDVSGSGPSNNDPRVTWYSADQVGTSQDPKLVVEAGPPPAPPISPTDLLTENQTNPTNVTSTLPKFSAIYKDPDVNDTSHFFQLQVSASSTDWTTPMWDSGKTVMATTTQGSRSPDITYDGTPLSLDGSTYYWRIKFWDSYDAEGIFSTSTASFTLLNNSYVTTYTYNGLNLLTKITDALGNVRNFTYDGLGRRLTAQDLHASSDSTYGTWTYTYDDAGNLTKVVDPKSQTINRTYDDVNRALTEDYTGQAGTEVSYIYDSCTQGKTRLCTASSAAVTVNNTYNALGQLTQESKTLSGTSTVYATSYTYDRQGNQLTITDPDNSQVKYTYNAAGRIDTVQRKESTDGSFKNVVSNFDYNPQGKVSFQADANCIQTTNTYDASQLYRLTNKLTSISCQGSAGTFGFTSITATSSFWATGNIGSDGEDYSPIQNGTVTSISFYGNSWSGNPGGLADLQVSIYDASNNLISSGATTINSTLEWKTIPVTSVPVYATTVYHIAFSPSNWIIRYYEATGNNFDLQVTTSYPTLPNHISWVTQAGKDKFSQYANYIPTTTIIQNMSYTYDAVGDITKIVNASPNNASSSATFVYDDLYRLTSATVTSTATGVSPYTQTYTYDILGNITNKSDLGDYSYASSSTPGYANPDAAITIATSTLAYDNNGNVTSVSSMKLTWDYLNRPTRTGIGTSTSTYAYDPWGQRVKLTSATSTSATTTSFYPTKYFNISTGSATTTKHIFANGELIATVSGSGTKAVIKYVHADHLGGSNVISTASGTVAEVLDYYPYGSNRIDQQTSFNEQRKFIGQEYDPAMNLSYLNARYYDGGRGKFLSEDPTFLGDPKSQVLTNPQSLNSYNYANGNPITNKDPEGKQVANLIREASTFLDNNPEFGPYAVMGGVALSGLLYAINYGRTTAHTGVAGDTEPRFNYPGGPGSSNNGNNDSNWKRWGAGAGLAATLADVIYEKYVQIKGAAQNVNNWFTSVFYGGHYFITNPQGYFGPPPSAGSLPIPPPPPPPPSSVRPSGGGSSGGSGSAGSPTLPPPPPPPPPPPAS
jgi:RHS repeat-associated protein